MNSKIDSSLLNVVSTLDSASSLQCIIYAKNYRLAREFLRSEGYEMYEYPFINAFGVDLKASNIFNIAKINAVKYITKNTQASTLMQTSKKALNMGKTNFAQYRFSCAVIDTGISPHIDFMLPHNQIIRQVDFVNNYKKLYDDNGHGSFVAGVLAGKGIVSGGKYSGIASGVNIISLKALDHNGEAGAFNILKAMQWIYDNKDKYNIKVVCMSFGSNPLGSSDPLMVGAEVLWDSGICVVSAAGNSGPDSESIKSPGASTKIITVGAINATGEFKIADFSSRGPIFGNYKPDVVAPGVDIMAACNYKKNNQHYSTMSGTSVATPMIAGICVNMLSKNPRLTPNQIKQILSRCSKPISASRNEEGYGLVDYEKIMSSI